ncbi:arginase family protein [Bailinhaonella thermotolerans]|uniref:arginase family protein n=1 Tax=Bailinhaonella thermotolerans TaxID=1070861 RepID=UPI00192A69E3|nr:arginase family protein [Bailinhaonella thermotolerans]
MFGVPVAFDSDDPLANGGPEAVRAALPYLWPRAPRRLWDWNAGGVVDSAGVLPLDLGDVRYDRREDRAADVERRLTLAVGEITRHGGRPLILGGEHWLTYPVLAGLLGSGDRQVDVIHFDAHTDRPAAGSGGVGTLRNSNVMSFVEDLSGVRRLLQLGVREFDVLPPGHDEPPASKKAEVVACARLLGGESAESLFAPVEPGSSVYLSIDVDVLDPAVAPEVGWPVPGGLGLDRLLELIAYVGSAYDVVGADVVEVHGSAGRNNLAALAAARCVRRLVLGASEGHHYAFPN